jgi:hypothetical protein
MVIATLVATNAANWGFRLFALLFGAVLTGLGTRDT